MPDKVTIVNAPVLDSKDRRKNTGMHIPKKQGYWEKSKMHADMGIDLNTTIDPLIEIKPETLYKAWYLARLASTRPLNVMEYVA